VTFADANANSTTVTFDQAGTYTLTWTTADGCSDDVVVTVNDDCDCPITDNNIDQPQPSEYCGESDDITITGGAASPTPGDYQWEVNVNGTGWVAATPVGALQDFAAGILTEGMYQYRRIYSTTTAPICADTSNVIAITVAEQPTAGDDKSLECITFVGGSTTLDGSGTGTWSVINSAGGGVDIVSPTAAVTEVANFTKEGTYTFRYGTAECFDEVDVVVTAAAIAGADQTAECFETATITVSAEGSGQWTWETSSQTATITDQDANNTTIKW